MEPFTYAIGSVILVSLLSLIGVFTLSLKKKELENFLHTFIAFAAGTLLAAAMLHMLPEAVEHSENALQFAFLGILLFWFVEKFIHWHHCGKTECQIHSSNRIRPVGYLNLIGDGIHNLIDGAVIMAAYLSSIPLGITATLAIVAHEIPQEIGDFAVLLHSGMKRKQALLLNFGSALLAIVGAFLAYFAIEAFENLEPLLLGFAAGGFIYIALTDLMPELHRECDRSRQVSATLALLAGIGLIYLSIQLLPHA